MTSQNRLFDAFYVLAKVTHLRTVFFGQAITSCVGNIQNRCASLDSGFANTRKVLIISTSCIFGVKFYVFHKRFCVLDSRHRTFQNGFACRVEFKFDVRVRSADSSVDSRIFGKNQRLGSYFYVFFDASRKGANARIFDCFCNHRYAFKVART